MNFKNYSKIIVANWKMNGSFSLINQYKNYLKKNYIKFNKKIAIVICPPFPYLTICKNKFKYKNIFLGAQNLSLSDNFSKTGEISSSIIRDTQCNFVILGHSERRNLFKESDKLISNKVNESLNNKINVIICIGENLSEKRKSNTFKVLKKQIYKSLSNNCSPKNTIIAYEPVWSIGTGKTPTIEEINKIHTYIKKILNIKYYLKNYKFKVLYGGSVNKKNSKDILSLKSVDGVLVGGASLNIIEFAHIINFNKN